MQRVLTALGLAIFVTILVITGWFVGFGLHSLPELGTELVSISETTEYWLALGIFSGLFFFLFTLPLSFMLTQK